MLQRINLVPQKPLSDRLKVITPIALFTLIALIFVYVFANYRLIESKIASTERENTAIKEKQVQNNSIVASQQKLAKEIGELTKHRDKLAAEVNKIESIRSKKRFYTKALNIISGTLPSTVKCNRIAFEDEVGILEGIAVKYQDLPTLVRELKDNSFIKYAVLNEVDRASGEGSTLTFKITFGIE